MKLYREVNSKKEATHIGHEINNALVKTFLYKEITITEEEINQIIKWMDVAKCPNHNCDNGAIGSRDFQGDVVWEQCQWCDEKERFKAKIELLNK